MKCSLCRISISLKFSLFRIAENHRLGELRAAEARYLAGYSKGTVFSRFLCVCRNVKKKIIIKIILSQKCHQKLYTKHCILFWVGKSE